MKIKNLFLGVATAAMAMAAASCSNIDEGDRLIYVKPAEVGRAILIEDFTGQKCINCPTGTEIINSIVETYGEENVIAYQVGLLRRFKPLVAVGHDREGEYGHGAHRLNALALEQAVVYAADASYDAESAAQYGVWDTPKLYLHFADENPIFLDVETPLESFGGKTAFKVASEAMLCHESQLQYAHRLTLASEEFPRYDCRRFGLVRSLVGADTGNDIMEHLS